MSHSYNFCAIFSSVHLLGRANCRPKGLWLGWCPSPSPGSLSWLQEIADSVSVSPITRSLSKDLPPRSLGVSIGLGS